MGPIRAPVKTEEQKRQGYLNINVKNLVGCSNPLSPSQYHLKYGLRELSMILLMEEILHQLIGSQSDNPIICRISSINHYYIDTLGKIW